MQIKFTSPILVTVLMITGFAVPRIQAHDAKPKKVVFLAGAKSHGKGLHEYEEDCRLLKRCLETSPNLKGFRAEVHTNGWPKDPKTLDDADVIVIHSDGSDHDLKRHPFLIGDRLKVIEKQMKRGCGIVAFHYALFVPNKDAGEKFLNWMGGYFDYQSGTGPRKWFSKIKTATTKVEIASPKHPISQGVKPFQLKEEYYYNMKLAKDNRLVPIFNTTIPGEKEAQTVAWAVQRKDGGRGFAFTGGHYHRNWDLEDLRRLTLNAIVWCAGAEVPEGGVQSTLAKAEKTGQIRALIVTGAQHPAHKWEQTTSSIRRALDARGDQFEIKVTKDPEFLAEHDLHHFDVVVMNYCNWNKPGLSEKAKSNFIQYLNNGGGLSIVHFANGAFHFSLPNKEKSDWEEWRTKICRRVWDHTKGKSGHDSHNKFRIEISNVQHPITQGLSSWETTDELYFRQQGTEPIEVLATARSKVTGKDEPMAFVYKYGKARIFQTVLGHDVPAIRNEGTSALLRRGTLWAAGGELEPYVSLKKPLDRFTTGKFGKALNANAGGIYVKGKKEYVVPPLTVECWTKLNNKRGFNILVASEPKSSTTHWELYTFARNGKLSAYLPGATPSEIVSNVNVCDDEWHHVAMHYEANRVRLYVNGRLVKDQKIQRKTKKAEGNPLAIGQLVERTIGCDGLIDDVRISKGIREIKVAPKSALKSDDNTLLLMKFDGEDDSIIDPAWTPRVDLNTQYPWMKETDKDWTDGRFQNMDTGRFLGATVAVPGIPRTYKGISIRLGDKNEAAMIFDTNLLRMSAGWTGKYLTHSSRRFGLLNTPKAAGDIQFVTPEAPGWSNDEIESAKKASPNVPLPRKQGRFKGAYRVGNRTVLSYTVQDATVLDAPWIEQKNGIIAFTRELEISPSKQNLSMLICKDLGKGTKTTQGKDGSLVLNNGKEVMAIAGVGKGKIDIGVQKPGQVWLTIPKRDEVDRIKLVIWKGNEKDLPKFQTLVKASATPDDLTTMIAGKADPDHKPLITKGVVGSQKTGSFVVDTLTMPYKNPHNALMFASGIDTLSNGDLVVCTAHGDVWVVKGVNEKLDKLQWYRFATGLYQPLGLKVVDDKIYVLERGQLTCLHDTNNDVKADYFECINNEWSVLGEEHGFTTCLEQDSKGNFYFFKTGSHGAFSGGCLLRVSKDGQKMEIFCTGFRHPNGLGMGPGDIVTGAGQEGNWVPKTRIDVYRKGGFYGDMRAHHRIVPPQTYDGPLCWLPREIDNSGGGQVWVPPGKWGPLGGRMLHFSYGHCSMMMVLHEQVNGKDQGGVVVFPMRFLSGACRGRFSSKDGHLYLCGLDGWQTAAVKDGCVHRVRYTDETPLVPIAMNVHKNGIRLEFTEKLDAKSAANLNRYLVQRWNYRWSGEYGSKDWSVENPDEQGRDTVKVTKVRLLEDGRSVFLEIPDMKAVMQMKIQYSIKSAKDKVIEGEVHSTIHELRAALK